ncbi:unnamed protein product [Taenia asiatica]|uniref:RM50 protein n=1 Tax=Taenia asiatica TaxID=60517 RepID=A0A0R3VYY5_TAEAS|nr:unnamed protein product [Taenia asiatica]
MLSHQILLECSWKVDHDSLMMGEEEPQPPPSRWECLLAWLKALLPQAPQTTRVPRAWFRANYDLLEGKNTKITGKYLAE